MPSKKRPLSRDDLQSSKYTRSSETGLERVTKSFQNVQKQFLEHAKKRGSARTEITGIPVCHWHMTEPSPSSHNRVLDALSRLLVDNKPSWVCSAIAYDPLYNKLLFSSNGDQGVIEIEKIFNNLCIASGLFMLPEGPVSESQKFDKIITILCDGNNFYIKKLLRDAISSITFSGSMPQDVQLREIYNKHNPDKTELLIKEFLNKMLELKKQKFTLDCSALNMYDNAVYKDAFQCASLVIDNLNLLNKIEQDKFSKIREVIDSFRGPIEDLHKVARAFVGKQDYAWVSSIKEGNYEAIKPNHGIHAEANIMWYFIQRLQEKNIQISDEIYIGISKLCCIDCENGVVCAGQFNFGDDINEKKICFQVRGGHGFKYSNPPPEYATKNLDFFEKLIENLHKVAQVKRADSRSENPDNVLLQSDRKLNDAEYKDFNKTDPKRATRSPSTEKRPSRSR